MLRIFYFTMLLVVAVVAALPVTLMLIFNHSGGFLLPNPQSIFGGAEEVYVETEELRLVGDVMLARHVETLMERYGDDYPYQHLESSNAVAWVGNFEGAVPDTHKKTDNYMLDFSVNQDYLDALEDFGFSHLSLANNHSFDFGATGYSQTIENLELFTTFGHPKEVTEASVVYTELGEVTVGLLALNAVENKLSATDYDHLMYSLSLNSDVQIAYVHWGDEYSLIHNKVQETLARRLIDDGIDMVVGHHPHVVQDIDMYEGKPIFYSLGNFIFDQYFTPEVQEGLIVALRPDGDQVAWELLPIRSDPAHSAPRLLEGIEREQFLDKLARRSDPTVFLDVLGGQLTLAP